MPEVFEITLYFKTHRFQRTLYVASVNVGPTDGEDAGGSNCPQRFHRGLYEASSDAVAASLRRHCD